MSVSEKLDINYILEELKKLNKTKEHRQKHSNEYNEEKREAGGQNEFSVGLAVRRDASPMSRHNQQRSVEEGRSLLGGAHAIKV